MPSRPRDPKPYSKEREAELRLGGMPMCENNPLDGTQCQNIGYRWGAIPGCSATANLCGTHYREWLHDGLIMYGGMNRILTKEEMAEDE